MRDRLHQPHRAKACPLLPVLLPLANTHGVLGVALSGAGPSVLLITANPAPSTLDDVIRHAANDPILEVVHTKISRGVNKT
jgi:homoserine kinase